MRDETVTKKKPKTMMRIDARKLPCVGILGATARKIASSSEPPSTTVIGMSRSVRSRAARRPCRRRSPSRCRGTTTTIVGIVRASVMSPAASTAPAPM